MLHTPKYIALNIKQFPTSAGVTFRGDVLTTETHGTTLKRGYIYSPCPYGQKSKLSKPISLCISWDSLDLSSAASRRYYVPRFRAYPCASVVGIFPTEGHLNIRES